MIQAALLASRDISFTLCRRAEERRGEERRGEREAERSGGRVRTSKRARMTQAGAFVYQGSGKRQDPNAPPEQRLCFNESVAIQR